MISIFVDQLPFDATEEDVRTLFEPLGRVHAIIIGRNRDLGEYSSFAMIEMDAVDTDVIAATDGRSIRGQTIHVSRSLVPQSSHAASAEQQRTRA